MGTTSSINSNKPIHSTYTVTDQKPAVPIDTSAVRLSSDEASVSILGEAGASSVITKKSSTGIYCDLCRASGDYLRVVGYCSDCKEYYCQSCYRGHSRSKATRNHNLKDHSSIYCGPCSTTGDFMQAEGYCSDCNEYYCQPCYRAHSRSKATRNHSLMDQSTMPTISITPPSASLATMNINKQSKTDDSRCKDEFHFVRDINIKHPHEKNDCLITRMTAISDNELVIINLNNKSVKMLDVDKNIMNSILFFDTEPLSITTIPNREVAVTFLNKQLIRIIHVSSTGELSVKQSIKLSGLCLAVQYVNNKMYVSFEQPVKFQILSLSGGVKTTIQPDAQVLQQCTHPDYIAVHPDESRMYVSDWKNDVVLCMDMHGTMLAVYKDVGLERPQAILFTPFNTIYLCNRRQHIIYKMADDLSEASIVLGSQDGLVFPTAMCFCPSRKYLYISSASAKPKLCDVIKQFKYS